MSEGKEDVFEAADIDALKDEEKEKLHGSDYPDPAEHKEATASGPARRKRKGGGGWTLLIVLFILFSVTGGASFWSYGWLLFLVIPMVWGCGRRYC